MQKDLTTLLAERDAQQHKAELEKLREENLRLLQQVSDRIDLAKAEITDSAITKTMAVLDHTRNWILGIFTVLAFVIAAASFIGINGISNKITAIATDNVRNWLRFEDSDNDTGSHKILNDLRTSALLDSLTVRSARDNMRGVGLGHVTLTPAEKARLMALILDPATDDAQFSDALNMVVKSRGMFGWMSEDRTGKQIVDILTNNDYSNSKRAYVMYAMRRDRSLYPLALNIINDHKAHYNENMLMDAFQNVKLFDEQRARKFAQEKMNSFKRADDRVELAKYLISIGADGPAIDDLIAELKKQETPESAGSYKLLIFARISQSLKASPQKIPVAAGLISTQIDAGLEATIRSFTDEKPAFYLSLGNNVDSSIQPENLMGNAELVDAVVKAKPVSAARLQRVSDFFQTTDRKAWITTLMMTPAAITQLKFDNGQQVRGDEILDAVWLRVEKKAGQPALIASWRSKTGQVHEGVIADVIHSDQAQFHVDFNRWQLNSYSEQRTLDSDFY